MKGDRAEEPENWLLTLIAVCLQIPISASPPHSPPLLPPRPGLLFQAVLTAAVPGSSLPLCSPADKAGTYFPSTLRCCSLKNGCGPRAPSLVILMSSNPKQKSFCNLSCPIASRRHPSIRNSLPLTTQNKKEPVYAVFYCMHKDFFIM